MDAAGGISANVLSPISWTYQWKRDGVLLGNPVGMQATWNTPVTLNYPIAKMTPSDEGRYSVIISNASGVVESNTVGVAIRYLAPRFLGASFVASQQVLAIPSNPGSNINAPAIGSVRTNDVLRVSVRGQEPMSYQWAMVSKRVTTAQGSRVVIPGQNTQNLNFATIPKNPGTYVLTVSNAYGSVNLNFFISSISGVGSAVSNSLTIISQPPSMSFPVGGIAWLSVIVNGSPSAYVWYKRVGTAYNPVSGGNGEVILFENFSASDAGTYFVQITDNVGNVVRSQDAILSESLAD